MMQYRQLGQTDLSVSLIALGTMTWGEQNTQAEAFGQMDYALDQGINFFDTAELYPVPPRAETYAKTEVIIGNWFAKTGRRDKVILATKATGPSAANSGSGHIRGGPRLSREQLYAAVDASLARLQTDYIDLYQLHWPERRTNFFGSLGYTHSDNDGVPIEETLSALGELVQQGKIRHIGLSNETPWGVMEYLRLSREEGLPRIASIQNPYNLLNRTFEIGLAECCIREQVSLLAYSPLGFGTLSGKYLGGARPEESRLTLFKRFVRYGNPQAEDAIEAYVALAREQGLDPAQMALAFVNSRDFMTSNIIGATSMVQLKSNIESLSLTLSDTVLAAIEGIHQRICNPSP